MKNSIVMAAVAGLASAAGAQTASLSIVPSSTTVDSSVSTSFTLAVYADADFGSHVAGGAFALSATGGDIVTGMDWNSTSWAGGGTNDRGYLADGNYLGVVYGQAIVPSFGLLPNAASALGNGPVLLGSFQVDIEADSVGVIDWSSISDSIATFVLEVYNEDNQTFSQVLNADFSNHGSATVNVIPAPSALALLGLGGLVAGGRRR